MEAQTIFYLFCLCPLLTLSLSLLIPSFSLFWSLFCGPRVLLLSRFLLLRTHSHIHCAYLPLHLPSLPYSQSLILSGWLPFSFPSYRSPSVPSVGKLCALRGEHPFYTNRAERERIRTLSVWVCALPLFFRFLAPMLVVYVYILFLFTCEQAAHHER